MIPGKKNKNKKFKTDVYTHKIDLLINDIPKALIIDCICKTNACNVTSKLFNDSKTNKSTKQSSNLSDGHLINISQMPITNSNARKLFLFESFGNQDLYHWPLRCDSYLDNNFVETLIFNGQAATSNIEFDIFNSSRKAHNTKNNSNGVNLEKGYILFALNFQPSVDKIDFNKSYNFFEIQCNIGTSSKPIEVDLINNTSSKSNSINTIKDRSSNLVKTEDSPFSVNIISTDSNKKEKKKTNSIQKDKDPRILLSRRLIDDHTLDFSKKLEVNSEFQNKLFNLKKKNEVSTYLKNEIQSNSGSNRIVEVELLKSLGDVEKDKKSVRFSPTSLESVSNTVKYKDWSVTGVRANPTRLNGISLAKKGLFSTSNQIGINDREFTSLTSVGNKIFVNSQTNIKQDWTDQTVKIKDYGVRIYRENDQNAIGTEIMTPSITVGTAANIFDRNYGMKFRLKDKEIGLRHDFDQHIHPDASKPATEAFVNWGNKYFNVGTDIGADRYSAAIGINKAFASSLIDIDDRILEIRGRLPSFGESDWDLYFQTDLPDAKSKTLKTIVGFGNNKYARAQGGFGIGNDGIPELLASVSLENIGMTFGWLGDDQKKRTLNLGFSLGEFSYNWISKLNLEKIPIPMLFGAQPFFLKDALKSFNH